MEQRAVEMPVLNYRSQICNTLTEGTTIQERQFASKISGNSEHFIIVRPDSTLDFHEQLQSLEDRYLAFLANTHLSLESAVFLRVYLSDTINQFQQLNATAFIRQLTATAALSIVGQVPLGGPKLALFAYHQAGPSRINKSRLSAHQYLIERNGVRHLWSTGLCAEADTYRIDPAVQTNKVFGNLIQTLTGLGGNLKENCIRTWIYLKDIDVFYQDMVEARKRLFATEGLTADTHYIASTGIEGACGHRFDLVAMDAYSILDLKEEQISYLNNQLRLCPTKNYGVTFERGTTVAYADRTHHFISGTAAIDASGNIVHEGEVIKQLEHALGNVAALLQSANSSFVDMMYLFVYLRNPTDYGAVNGYFARLFPGLPVLIVQGAVCRPGWLVEVEGQAISPLADKSLPAF
jgi:enamine deaminase RidA (YjgF/YER057c/UK114 family)